MNVLLFGMLADVTGKTKIEMTAKDVSSLKKDLFAKYPALTNCKFQVAVNKEKVSENTSLKEEDEVALLPPFAGG